MSNQKLKSLLLKAQSGSKKASYKKKFITGNGNEYQIRPLATTLIDPKEIPFVKYKLHGGYKHPNFEGDFSSNYTCIVKDCPMCIDVRALKKVEFENNLPRDMRTAWKKEKNQYAGFYGIDRENGELTLFMVPDTDRFKKVKNEEGKEEWKKTNTTCQEILFNKLMNAAENGLDPFDYKAGNDIIIRSKKVDNIVNWDISVLPAKNEVPTEILEKLKTLPKLEDLYKKYTKEELEYIVKGKPFNSNTTKQKQEEEKEETTSSMNEISDETFEDDAQLNDDDMALLEDDDDVSNLSESLRNILNK